MSNVSSILVLTHPDAPTLDGYFLYLVAKEWEARGIRVTVCHDLKTASPAEVCVVHVDLSVVPPEYGEVARRYPYTVNLHITDIRKRNYSRNRVTRGDGFRGPVIVKSSLNFGGVPERRAKIGWRRRIWEKFHRELSRRAPPSLPFQQPVITSKSDYRVFEELRLLPVGWLDREEIVVERFLPERHDDQFVLREWYFLGDREYYNCEISKDWNFTIGTKCLELAAPPPDAIRQVRKELRIDYGKVDYVMDSVGDPVLFDVNKTIGQSNPNSVRGREVARILSDGLIDCIRKPR
jgi:hypothetical protein